MLQPFETAPTIFDSSTSLIVPSHIRKRDGVTLEPFDIEKLRQAVSRAWQETKEVVDEAGLNKAVINVLNSLREEQVIDVEYIQDAVEVALMRQGQFDIARAYILYRSLRAEIRNRVKLTPDPVAISDYIHASKYAKYLPELKRREVYLETVARTEAMHVLKYPHLETEINWAFDQVRAKRVLPSMRSMQFGGQAILANNTRIYNCSFSLVDRYEVFSEALFLLLSGTGVGYSVQFDHVEKLPNLGYIDSKRVVHHVIADTIEGWADALKALVESYIVGYNIELSYHLIRGAGTPLKTSGGRAPGHLKLKSALENIRRVLNGAQGRKLRPIECHRIMCHAADAVLSGGIRRSAMICLFSLDDSEMMNIKTGDWYSTEPYFANANNSVVLKRDEVTKKQFKRIFNMTRQWGEPGFYFTASYDYGTNPCCEIGLNPRFTVDSQQVLDLLRARGVFTQMGDVLTGWAFCNLCEINAAKLTNLEAFEVAAKAATLIGTLQAGYTQLDYLGATSELIAKREALLGIGMTGMLDAPHIACHPEYQKQIAQKIKAWNEEYADKIGINPAARTTCVKPSGTTSLELGSVASGHHAHHAERYIRRVTADELEFVFQAFKTVNPHMCVRKPDGKWVIQFPVQAPEGAIVRSHLSAIKFLAMVKSTQQNWVVEGSNTTRHNYSPGLSHNVSNTITVRPEEWGTVSEYLWENREYFTGVSLLAATGDKDFAFAPMEEIQTQDDEALWDLLLAKYTPVDYSSNVEHTDSTDLKSEPACAGGVCLIV